MSLTEQQKTIVSNVLKASLRNKFLNYKPEPAVMPFHTRLLGKDRLALFSFIQSLNTTFGTSVFEPVAIALSSNHFKVAKTQVISGEVISEGAQRVIQNIMDDLTTAAIKPDKISEIQQIRAVCQTGNLRKVKPTRVDVFLENYNDEIFLIDIKTAKPNAGDFIKFKRTLLEWIAVILAINPDAKVNTLIAIPYNPYEPKPYQRWTIGGMLDLENELKVAEGFWDFLSGTNCYQDLLDIFETVGIELRSEIDNYFTRFQKT